MNKNNLQLPSGSIPGQPITALAPMQDVTHLPFMTVLSQITPPDYFFTEYFRVHEHSRLEPHILSSITQNPSNCPVFAQLIGEDIPHMIRTAKALLQYPIAGIDLNMGCPAPKVYKKNVGGGLLKDLPTIDKLLGALRDAIPTRFTVKMRIGFDHTNDFEALINLINKHNIDLLSLHGRTVKEMYRSEVHYDFIQYAAHNAQCPVLANGNINSLQKAIWTLENTQAFGVMIGRGAIRNPWIFQQIQQHFSQQPIFQPKLEDVFYYIQSLYKVTNCDTIKEKFQVNRMKKYLIFIGQGVDPEGFFLKEIRRVQSESDFFTTCENHLLKNNKAHQLFSPEPYEGIIARPNCETPLESCSALLDQALD